jgi:hypothetical protein
MRTVYVLLGSVILITLLLGVSTNEWIPAKIIGVVAITATVCSGKEGLPNSS